MNNAAGHDTDRATILGPVPPECKMKDDFFDDDMFDFEWEVAPPNFTVSESQGRQLGAERQGRKENGNPNHNPGPRPARTGHTQATPTPTTSPSQMIQPQEQKARRARLKNTAVQTISVLAHLVNTSDYISTATRKAYRYTTTSLPRLDKKQCPRFVHPRPVRIRVVNEDTIDAALGVQNCSRYFSTIGDSKPVCILNMANATRMGGGFKNGALAQEEALCYRSSLFFTLKKRFYPLQDDTKPSDPKFAVVYSPSVFVIRENMNKGHTLLDISKPSTLPVVSAVSAAALKRPPLKKIQVLGVRASSSSSSSSSALTAVVREVYARQSDREIMKEKLRMIIRSAAHNGHRRLVLSAFGCGCFENPATEVADCWAEVFQEAEFRGGWWESIVFAILDNTVAEGEIGDGNFGIFHRKLNGMVV